MSDDPREVLPLYTIYFSPSDVPGKYVVRRFRVTGSVREPVIDHAAIVCDTLTEARAAIPEGLFNLGRNANDEPQIVETWI